MSASSRPRRLWLDAVYGGVEFGAERGWEYAIEAAIHAMPHDEECPSLFEDADERDCACWRPKAIAALEQIGASE